MTWESVEDGFGTRGCGVENSITFRERDESSLQGVSLTFSLTNKGIRTTLPIVALLPRRKQSRPKTISCHQWYLQAAKQKDNRDGHFPPRLHLKTPQVRDWQY